MRVAVVPNQRGGGVLAELGADGIRAGTLRRVDDLSEAVAGYERGGAGPVRWVWADTAVTYRPLLEGGRQVARCHDIMLVEGLLLGYHGRLGESRSLGAAWARLRGLRGREVPPDPAPPSSDSEAQQALFEPEWSTLPPGVDPLDALVEVHTDQWRRVAATDRPERFALLAAAESAGALAASEMARHGVPWSVQRHDEVLTEQLGPRPLARARPPVLADLAERISEAFGRPVNPDSPAQLMKAFSAVGRPIPSTRSLVLRGVDHPVVPLLLRYKELARLHSAHGWAWLDARVREGRFRPDYVVGGVVSGRWATRGGGALQIPKIVRRAVVADEGWTLVVADAGQLEPRILAAVSGDDRLAEAAGDHDLYAALAPVFGGDRQRAKIGLLAAMYGQTGGDAAAPLRLMRERFPRALDYVDTAARAGEEGRLVRSWLGRTCPPPPSTWRRRGAGEAVTSPMEGDPPVDGGRAVRDRGRFTRNFVIQATAAEWALVFMAALRRRLAERFGWYGEGEQEGLASAVGDAVAGPRPRGVLSRPAGGAPQLVFFQHDEVVLHAPRENAQEVVRILAAAEAETRRLLFGDTPVRFPLDVAVVECYADA